MTSPFSLYFCSLIEVPACRDQACHFPAWPSRERVRIMASTLSIIINGKQHPIPSPPFLSLLVRPTPRLIIDQRLEWARWGRQGLILASMRKDLSLVSEAHSHVWRASPRPVRGGGAEMRGLMTKHLLVKLYLARQPPLLLAERKRKFDAFTREFWILPGNCGKVATARDRHKRFVARRAGGVRPFGRRVDQRQ